MKIVFTVRCTPVAQPRQRHRIFKARGGQLCVQNYTPSDSPVTTFKDRIRFEARRVYRGEPLLGPLAVEIVFIMPRPEYMNGRGKTARAWHIVKPDMDNLEKSLFDALTGIVWKDDCQACDVTKRKQVAAAGEQPSISVSIEQLEPAAKRQGSLFA